MHVGIHKPYIECLGFSACTARKEAMEMAHTAVRPAAEGPEGPCAPMIFKVQSPVRQL